MATYETSLPSPIDPDALASEMVDMRSFEAWDPGLESVRLIDGTVGVDAVFEVKASGLTLEYRTVEADLDGAVKRIRLVADGIVRSDDVVTIEPHGTGSLLTYHAELGLGGPLGWLTTFVNPLLGPAFNRIGDRAAEGLRERYGVESAERV